MIISIEEIDRYISNKEERKLLVTYHTHGCLVARNRLVSNNIKFIWSLAHKLHGYNVCLDDLVNEGVIGLIKAIDNFDLSKSNNLRTYAKHYIMSEMYNYAIENISIINSVTTKAKRKKFFNGYKEDVLPRISRVNVNEIRDYNTVSPLELIEIDERRNIQVNTIRTVLTKLKLREAEIIVYRYLVEYPVTLKTLAKLYNISIARVQQIERVALMKMRISMCNGVISIRDYFRVTANEDYSEIAANNKYNDDDHA